jgi:outer membrane protein assembly factor BamE (lipoprotein component of BamABCDE complex)
VDLKDAYAILEVPPGASRDEVRLAYRDLLKVWHPDRHSGDPALQRRAEDRLKRIIAAYDLVEEAGFPSRPSPSKEETPPPRPQSTPSPPRTQASPPNAANRGAPPPRATEVRQPPQPAASEETAPSVSSTNTGGRLLFSIVATLVVVVIWQAYKASTPSTPAYEPTSSYSSPSHSSATYEQAPARPLVTTPPSAADVELPAGAAPSSADETNASFTLGSTRDEVQAAQGTPTEIDKTFGESWSYSGARVEFRNGRVFAWSGTPYVKLNVILQPKNLTEADKAKARGYFTLGSTKDEVLALQGTPDQLDRTYGETWWYGASTIRFSNGKVFAWDSSPMMKKLAVELHPSNSSVAEAASARGFYGPKATKDEVLAVEGTPQQLDRTYGETWWYGASTIRFSSGRITEYDSSQMRPLKVRIVLAPENKIAPGDEATVDGFSRTLMAAIDKATDDICACSTLACARDVAATMQDRGMKAGYAYTRNRVMTPELKDFMSTMLATTGSAFTDYFKEHYADWFASFKLKFEGCVGRLKGN